MTDATPSKVVDDAQADNNVAGEAGSLSPEEQVLSDLRASLASHARSGTFACGGYVEIDDPVQIRFGDNGKGVTLVFPDATNESSEFEALAAATQPASFGRGDEELLDEGYRKAGKLDRNAFATSFCPYEAGIIDIVSQLLLPQTKHAKDKRSIRAQLYKLNIYSAPDGKFKAHVDTPRSEEQLGSLVVYLPIRHEGGHLIVRNAGQKLTFDWSTPADGDDVEGIHWAAFYSDCEHEVLEVTSGHRLTLTYNLFMTRGVGHLAGFDSGLDPETLPLYDFLSTALNNREFFRHGRVLAIWLTHSYAHTNKHINFLPASLKGADMSLYETACALGLRCILGPVLPASSYDYEIGHKVDLLNSKFHPFNAGANSSGNLDVEEGRGFGDSMPPGKVTWVNPAKKYKDKDGKKKVHDELHELREPQMAYMTYGNEPGIAIHYSRAAMLIHIPPFRKRFQKVNESDNFWKGIQDDFDEEYYCDTCSDDDHEHSEDEEEQEKSDDDYELEDSEWERESRGIM